MQQEARSLVSEQSDAVAERFVVGVPHPLPGGVCSDSGRSLEREIQIVARSLFASMMVRGYTIQHTVSFCSALLDLALDHSRAAHGSKDVHTAPIDPALPATRSTDAALQEQLRTRRKVPHGNHYE